MTIKCCKDCVPPKRHPGCHATCPEYIAERAEYDRLKAIHDREQEIDGAIGHSRSQKVYKAMKNRKYKKI